MASLTGQTIASSYEQLLHTDTDGGGNGNSLLSIKDGDNGTTFALKLATNKVEVIPGSDDANAFEVSKADGTAVLTVDSTNARVGIGTASPAKPLEIEGSGAEAELIYLTSTQASNVSNRIRISHRLLTDSQERTSFSLLSGFNTITDASRNSIVEFKTSNAGTFGTAMVIDGGNVGIGTDSPDKLLEVSGATTPTIRITDKTSASHSAGDVHGAIEWYSEDVSNDWPGVQAYIAAVQSGASANPHSDLYFQASESSSTPEGNTGTNPHMVIQSTTGNVGIGIDSSILGDVHIKKDAAFLMLEATAGGASPSDLKIQQDYRTSILGTSAGDGQFVFKNNVSSAGEPKDSGDVLMVIQDGPAVGIGTASPSSALQVVGAFSSQIKFGTNTSVYTNMSMGTGFTVLDSIGGDSGAFDFRDDGASRMFIDSSGNVGIGETNPSTKLHIAGNAATSGDAEIRIVEAGNNATMQIGYSDGNGFFLRLPDDANNEDVIIRSYGNTVFNGGSVGIGTASPSRLLDLETTNAGGSTLMSLVSATDGNCQLLFGDTDSDTQGKVLYNNDGDYMAFTANGSERMRIDSSGNVGIGTINPTYKLDVEESGAGTFPASVVHSDGTTPRGLRITFSGGNSFGNTDDYAIFFEDNTAAHFYVAGDGSVQNVSGTYGSALSDERLKENIVDATGKLDDLLKLKVKNFTFTNDSTATKHIGFIAQEFEQVFPSLVTERDDSEHSGITDLKGLQVGMEFAILVKAIQELSAQNDSLTARIEALENA